MPLLIRPLLVLLVIVFPTALRAAEGISAELAVLKQQVTDATGLDDARRTELVGLLDAGTADVAALGQMTADATRMADDARRAQSEARRLERELAQDTTAEDIRLRREIELIDDPETLEGRLQSLYDRIDPLRREQQAVSAGLDALDAGVGGSIARLQEAIAALDQELARGNDGSLEARIRHARKQAELALRRAELARAETSERTEGVRREALELKQRLLRQQLAGAESLALLVQARLGERTESELRALLEQLSARQAELAQAPAPIVTETGVNLGLGQEYAEANRRLAAVRVQTTGMQAERERIERALRDSASRLALGATSEAVGAVLLRERQRLPLSQGLQRNVQALRDEGIRIRLRLFDIGDSLSQTEAHREQLLAETVEEGMAPAQAAVTVDALLRSRTDLLRRLDTTLRRLLERIEQAEVALEGQLTASVQLKALLDRQLFWIPSHQAVNAHWIAQSPAGWADLLAPARLADSLQRTWRHASAQPIASITSALVVALLFALQHRARRQLPELARPTRRIREDSYRYTWLALAWTLLAALPWAALAWLTGALLQGAGEPGKYTHSLGAALAALSGSIALFTFLRWMVIDNGLAHAHFRWTRARRESIARAVPRAALPLLPAQFLSTLALVRGQDLAIDTAGRSLLLVFALASCGVFWWLLAPGRLWSPRGGVAEPVRMRQGLRVGLPLLLLFTVGLTLTGYVFTASVLVLCLWQTGGALLAVSMLHGLLARWFLLGERRLALRRAEERRAAAESSGEQASDGELPPEVEADQLDIQSISAQTKRLLRAISATTLVVLMFWVWADILPALQRLDEIALWSFSDKAADGSAIVGMVSVRAALVGTALLLLTIIAARNLPGLIEIGLLSRINLDAPSRYAITSLARYAIVIVGVMVGLSFLGMRWSQLQWMAAALTVGLGFGLQEIFANFVSGLILLFERPFRVGDIITIGEFNGRVTRIRTRATTILDSDNREVVIPNKAFITDRLTNWTLTDTMTRLVVKVGVAYGTDVSKVHALLLRAAQACSYITQEPPPRTWFLAFGASSLDFELRVFVPSIDQRTLAQNDLHGRIASLFAEHDIEIAYPQMDLHVRNLPAPVPNTAAPPQSRDGDTDQMPQAAQEG